MRSRPLLEDGELLISVESGALTAAEPWIPQVPGRGQRAPAAHPRIPSPAHIHVRRGEPPTPPDTGSQNDIEVLDLRGWVADDQVHVLTRDRAVGGTIDLERRTARICIDGAPGDAVAARQLFAALTVAAGLLLNRQDRLLLHAAGLVAPDGGAWLLVGDSGTGKSSTCANAIRGGWKFLADDQVVVGQSANGVLRVEGWPRSFNLDVGFESGTSTGERVPVDPASLGTGPWRRSAPLAGIFLPQIAAGEATSLEPASSGAAMGSFIRQSPWLLADAVAAPRVLALMTAMAALPVHGLRLGLDGYRSTDLILAVLKSAMAPTP